MNHNDRMSTVYSVIIHTKCFIIAALTVATQSPRGISLPQLQLVEQPDCIGSLLDW